MLMIGLANYQVKAQNIFYDAKRIIEWSSRIDDATKRNSADTILGYIQKYGTPDSADLSLFNLYKKAKELAFSSALKKMDSTQLYSKLVASTKFNDNELKSKIASVKFQSHYFDTALRHIETVQKLIKSNSTDTETLKIIYRFIVNSNQYTVDTFYNKLVSVDTAKNREFNDSLSNNSKVVMEVLFKKIEDLRDRFEKDFLKEKEELIKYFLELEGKKQLEILGSNNESLLRQVKVQYNKLKQQDLLVKNLEKLEVTIQNNSAGYAQNLSNRNFPSQSEIIDALAIYMANRFKQEVAISFIEQLTKYLKNNSLAKDLFPQTWKVLAQESFSYSLPKFGSEWRNALSSDFINLPQNFVNCNYFNSFNVDKDLRDYLRDGILFANYAVKKYSFIDIIRTLNDNQETGGPDTLRSTWAKKTVFAAYVINEELYDTSRNKFWLSPESLHSTDTNSIRLMYELTRLKYEKRYFSLFNTSLFPPNEGVNLHSLKRKYTELLSIYRQFENMQPNTGKDAFWDNQRIILDFILKQFPKEGNARTGVEVIKKAFYTYDYISNNNFGAALNSIIEIIETAAAKKNGFRYWKFLISEKHYNVFEQYYMQDNGFKKQVSSLESCMNAYYAMIDIKKNGEKISAATLSRTFEDKFQSDSLQSFIKTNIIDKISSNFSEEYIKDLVVTVLKDRKNYFFRYVDSLKLTGLMGLNNDLFKRNWDDLSIADYKLYGEHLSALLEDKAPNLVRQFRQATAFLSDVTTTKNSKELSNVIESYAMAPGSYKIKRRARMSIDLNGYVGAYAGEELLFLPNRKHEWKGVGGFTVPIGLSLSFGTRHVEKNKIDRKLKAGSVSGTDIFLNGRSNYRALKGNSYTFFVSIVDIAAPFSYRITDSNTEGLPKDVTWSQILAPGFHFMWGIKNTPICVVAGCQIVPQLRTFKEDNIEKRGNTFRASGGLVFDLPLYNFYHRTAPQY
jgi:hypothetical protein